MLVQKVKVPAQLLASLLAVVYITIVASTQYREWNPSTALQPMMENNFYWWYAPTIIFAILFTGVAFWATTIVFDKATNQLVCIGAYIVIMAALYMTGAALSFGSPMDTLKITDVFEKATGISGQLLIAAGIGMQAAMALYTILLVGIAARYWPQA